MSCRQHTDFPTRTWTTGRHQCRWGSNCKDVFPPVACLQSALSGNNRRAYKARLSNCSINDNRIQSLEHCLYQLHSLSDCFSTIYYIEDLDSLRFALSMIDYDVAKLQPHFPAYPVFLFHRQTALCSHPSLCISIFATWRAVNFLHNLFYTKDCEDQYHHTVGKNHHLCGIHESFVLVDEQPLYARCNGGCVPISEPLLHNNTSGKWEAYIVGFP